MFASPHGCLEVMSLPLQGTTAERRKHHLESPVGRKNATCAVQTYEFSNVDCSPKRDEFGIESGGARRSLTHVLYV